MGSSKCKAIVVNSSGTLLHCISEERKDDHNEEYYVLVVLSQNFITQELATTFVKPQPT